jgi:caffeoyl-CoA O-methyltransferase
LGGAAFQSVPLAKDEAEKRILEALEEMSRGGLGMSAPRDDARLLRLLVESSGAKHAVELGTFRGYSSIWMCLGLRTTGGRLTTFEIDKRNADLSRQNFRRAGVEPLVTLIEGDAHKEVSRLKEPIDLVFIDADKEGYLDYLNQLLPVVRPGGLIVAHNINATMADPAYIKAITTNASLETLFINAGNDGISVSMKKR